MLDPALFRENLESVRAGITKRGVDLTAELEDLATLETQRRRLLPEIEGLKRDQNAAGDEVARAKRQGLDAAKIQEASRQRAQQIKQLSVELDSVEQRRNRGLLVIPNLPHESVPVGKTSDDNVEVRRHGTPPAFDFTAQPHWDLGPALGIIDFERGTKIAGARFSVLLGAGARLARALINFMLHLHTTEHGYTEVEPPFMVNTASLTGTGDISSGFDDTNIYGGLLGNEAGEMNGGFGYGRSGFGPGGGGTGWGTIGTGRYGTIGHGSGTGSGTGAGRSRAPCCTAKHL